jgi:hypothetical protein
MARLVATFLLLAVVAGSLGCSPSVRVRHDWDEGADFSNLKSFDILDTGSIQDPLIARRISDAVHVHLDERGFVKDTADPDFLIETEQKELIWRGWGSGTLGSSTREAHVLQDVVDRILNQFPPK